MSPLTLKVGATALTLAGLFGSAAFVARHVKDPGAPLHPAVVQTAETPRAVATATPRTRLNLQPNVRTTDEQSALTFTYVS